ncbi:unnamed protein product [Acanthoscelides obtectus]|uniref:Uncharacterized protein n=1 Tax=Acanthoscelides obtectus TaxID=200917 RepID=A0A9P0JSD8_ACAOB|nr:unnamed protein product [Acanthoscelides obtectus]CAK1663761.1 hypothetical protein AOBTE_LOCUS23842 [Acanthoscelides obtectus]
MASRAQKILSLVREQEKTKSALEELDNTAQTDSQTVVPAVPSTLPERHDEHISTFNGFDINSMEIVLADDVLEIDEAEFNLPPAELGINVCGLEDKDLDLRHRDQDQPTAGSHGNFSSSSNESDLDSDSVPDFLNLFFDDLPKQPSHYVRKDTSKFYLEQHFVTLKQLHNFYREVCDEKNKHCLGIKVFKQIFKEKNLSLFSPKKDVTFA